MTLSNRGKFILLGIAGVLIVTGVLSYPLIKSKIYDSNKITGNAVSSSKTSKEYYQMFQCSCCGQPIDVGCCGMAKQRKDYVDTLLLEGLEEDEVVYRMVKKFGFDILMDPSREQEVRDYIKNNAPENPPKIEIDRAKHDFGVISQGEGVVSTTFTIKNTGGSDLIIENIDSSCMCTTASLTYKGEESPVFGMSMHGDNPENFGLRIAPGDSAQLNVFYDTMAHGRQKKPQIKVIREVTIISNDPADFQKKVRIEVTQVP